MKPLTMVKLAALLTLALQLGGCGSAGARFYPLGGSDVKYTAPVPADKVELFITKKPDYKYTELGILTFDTAASFADEPRAYQKLREKAGEIGADGVIVMDSQSFTENYPRFELDYYGNPTEINRVRSYVKYRGVAIRRQ